MSQKALLTFVGDVMLGRAVSQKTNKRIFDNVKDIFKASDLTVANLEAPFGGKLQYVKNKKYVFKAKDKYCQILKDSGINLVTLANNHIVDCRKDGIERTVSVLEEYGVPFLGVQKNKERQSPHIVKKNGIRIGFLAYCKDIKAFHNVKKKPFIIDENIQDDVKKARKKCDFLILALHWGKEYKAKPEKETVKLAQSLIECGANAIIGNHPHVPQKIVKYKKGIIAYSLGNFVFDQQFNEKVREGRILQLEIDKNKILKYKIFKTRSEDNFQPIVTSKRLIKFINP